MRICEIIWVRGRGSGEFHAVVPAPDGGHTVLVRSPPFRWRVPLVSPDATPRAAAAHRALVRQLVSAGWQPVSGGGLNWYARRFQAPPGATVEPLGLAGEERICEITLARGQGDGEFQAIVAGPEGDRQLFARSPRFRCRGPKITSGSPGVAAAHHDLVRQLIVAGWHPSGGKGSSWYSHQFRPPEGLAAQLGTESDA